VSYEYEGISAATHSPHPSSPSPSSARRSTRRSKVDPLLISNGSRRRRGTSRSAARSMRTGAPPPVALTGRAPGVELSRRATSGSGRRSSGRLRVPLEEVAARGALPQERAGLVAPPEVGRQDRPRRLPPRPREAGVPLHDRADVGGDRHRDDAIVEVGRGLARTRVRLPGPGARRPDGERGGSIAGPGGPVLPSRGAA